MAPVAKQHLPLTQTHLRAWREKAGFDQESAAAQLDVSRTLLSKIENAKSPYSQRLLEKAATLYGATPAELIACDPADKDGIWSVWMKLADAPEADRRQIMSYAKFTLGLS